MPPATTTAVPVRRATRSSQVLGALAVLLALWAGLSAPSVSPVAPADGSVVRLVADDGGDDERGGRSGRGRR